MEIITAEDLMVPVDEFPTISEDATLYEAIIALEITFEEIDREQLKYLHRSILVSDNNKKIIGKISHLDILRALEPKYGEIGDTRTISRSGLSSQFLKAMVQSYNLCATSLTDMCKEASKLKVKNFMYSPRKRECVDSEASLCEAIHMLVIGHHQKLLVVQEDEIIGVLRSTDVFMKIFELMKQLEK